MIPNNEDNDIRSNLEEQFKKLFSEDAAPEEIKEEVFNTIDSLTFLGDLADLFTAKFGQTESELLDLLQEPDKSQEEE